MKKFNSKEYWESRYINGGNSGNGSYNHLAQFKANVINKFIAENNINSIIEYGCGDGNQLSLLNIENYYGLDVSKKIITTCKQKFKSEKHKFYLTEEFINVENISFDLSLSLDVIFHLVEDYVYEEYMEKLINTNSKYLIIYSCNFKNDGSFGEHVNPREFSKHKLLQEKYEQIDFIKNQYPSTDHKKGSFSDFYIYKRK